MMPTGQGEGLLDESHTDEVNDPPTPTTTELPDLEQEVMSSPVQTHEKEGQVASIMSADNQSERENLSWEEGRSRSQKSLQSHVIKNVDDIFHTIEELMRKLHQLRVRRFNTHTLGCYFHANLYLSFSPVITPSGHRDSSSPATENPERAACQSRVW